MTGTDDVGTDAGADALERVRRATEARIARDVARMRAAGREPATREGRRFRGCRRFDFTLRWISPAADEAEIRVAAEQAPRGRRVHAWGEAWPEHGVVVSGGDLLALLARNWPIVAREFLADAGVPTRSDLDASETIDVARGIGRPDLPPFVLRAHGPELRIGTARGEIAFGAESVIVVEVLMALGDLLAGRLREISLRPEAVAAWESARARTDLLPFPEDRFDDGPDDGRVELEAAWYARRLGVDLDAYRLAAVWLKARRYLHAADPDLPAPTAAEEDVEIIPPGLPAASEVDRLAEAAAKLDAESPERFVEHALAERNMSARHVVFYRRWPERYQPRPRA